MRINAIGITTTYAGDPITALDLHEQALALARETDHREQVHRCLNCRGIALWALGRLDESVADHEQVLAYCRQAGQSVGEVASMMCLAEVYLDAGRVDEGGALAAQTLPRSVDLAERRTHRSRHRDRSRPGRRASGPAAGRAARPAAAGRTSAVVSGCVRRRQAARARTARSSQECAIPAE